MAITHHPRWLDPMSPRDFDFAVMDEVRRRLADADPGASDPLCGITMMISALFSWEEHHYWLDLFRMADFTGYFKGGRLLEASAFIRVGDHDDAEYGIDGLLVSGAVGGDGKVTYRPLRPREFNADIDVIVKAWMKARADCRVGRFGGGAKSD